jgi:hypothetical protein
MIKATGEGPNGRKMLFIGLSFGNLDKFRDSPLDTHILIDGRELGLPHDVLIFSGRSEAEMAEIISHGFGPNTKVNINNRSKN